MANDLTYLARAKAAPKYYALGLYRELSEKNVFLFAQAIAFKVLVTIVPIIVLATGITGMTLDRFFADASAFERIQSFIIAFLPAYETEQLILFLQQLLEASPGFALGGAIGLVLTAMTLFTTVRLAVAGAFEQDWSEDRPLVGGYLFDLRMVGQVGFFFILTILVTILAQQITTNGEVILARLHLDYTWLTQGWKRAFGALGVVIPFLITTLMFFQLFYFIPHPRPAKRSAMVGALVTGLMWEIAKYGFTFYASSIGNFDRYATTGSFTEDATAALGASFGLLIAFVFWIYYSGIVLMIGAIVASLNERHRRIRRQEAKDATAATAAAPGSKLDAAARERPDPKASSEPHEQPEQPEPHEQPEQPEEPHEQPARQDAP